VSGNSRQPVDFTASMKLLGEWNWWLPRKLEWLPQTSLAGSNSNTKQSAAA
jgi:hypothetical protein